MKETLSKSEEVSKNEEILKGISNFAKTIKVGSTSAIDELEFDEDNGNIVSNANSNSNSGVTESDYTKFKVCTNTLPEQTSLWTKVKNALCYKIEVKLTPYEQKLEDEINDFLYQEVTWSKFKDFFTQEIDITYKGKKIF